ncbi:MAG: alpha/beta fold hydrolase [Bacteroidota bacterium]
MNIYKKVFAWMKALVKWSIVSLASFLLLVLLAGLGYRLLMPAPAAPMGEMIDMGGYQMHLLAEGKKQHKPTLVMACGGGLSTEFFHWVSEGLKDSMRVVRYDRIGLGQSDALDTPRDPETVARRLHTLLKKAGESPPYIMMGHSLGGPHIRVFTELYPDEVEAMFFLDATHPDHVARYDAPKQTSLIYKGYLVSLDVMAVLCDLGIFPLYDRFFDTPYYGPGLPDDMNRRFKDAMRNGKAFRAFKEEMKYYYTTIARSGKVEDFGSLPIRAFHAVPEDPVQRAEKRSKLMQKTKFGQHKEYAELSTNAKGIEIPGNHVSIFTEKKNADIICREVMQVSGELERK